MHGNQQLQIDTKNSILLHGLYGISDCNLTPKSSIFTQLQQAIRGGLRIFQYRDKKSNDNEIRSLVQELQDFCSYNDILFILNDRYELAIQMGVSGLHLGKDELERFIDIRDFFSGIIGVSCYNDINMALQYERAGVNYVAFGSIFQSPTKPNANRCNLEVMAYAKQKLTIPICAIGGITRHNARLLRNCDMIAVISSLWKNTQPQTQTNYTHIKRNAKELLESWNKSI